MHGGPAAPKLAPTPSEWFEAGRSPLTAWLLGPGVAPKGTRVLSAIVGKVLWSMVESGGVELCLLVLAALCLLALADDRRFYFGFPQPDEGRESVWEDADEAIFKYDLPRVVSGGPRGSGR